MEAWTIENLRYVDARLEALRLRLRLQTAWLRQRWRQRSDPDVAGLVITEEEIEALLRGPEREERARFLREEAASLVRQREEADARAERALEAFLAEGTPPALETLALRFQLSSFERDTLLLCLAPERDPDFERLFAYVQDDATRRYATPHLALTLFCDTDADWLAARERFAPDAPLRRWGLLAWETASASLPAMGAAPLRLDARIADYLLGLDRPDERVAEMTQTVPLVPVAPGQTETLDRLKRWVRAESQAGAHPTLNLVGPEGSGRRALAGALCAALGGTLRSLELRRLPAPGPERREFLRLLCREAQLLRFGLYVETGPPKSDESAPPADLLAASLFLIVGSPERLRTDLPLLSVAVPRPETSDQRFLWREGLAATPHALDGSAEAVLDGLTQQFDLGPEAIARTLRTAESRARWRGDGDPLDAEDLWEACREQSAWHLDDLAQRLQPCHDWNDIVLPDDVSAQLREIAAQVANRAQIYETWGFGAKLNRGRGISALFAGPSGTGKTMAAEILANHLRLDLYRIDLSGVVNKYIGETEKNLRRVFDSAERSGAILFFDEADALFGKRSEVRDSHDRYANIEVNYLLQRMEEYRGLAILATNQKAMLDSAFLRRLRFLVDFPFPDAAQRADIWRTVFPANARVDALDTDALARMEITGGSIRNIALNAAFLAAAAGASVSMEHLFLAARREYAKMDRITLESEFGAYFRRVPA